MQGSSMRCSSSSSAIAAFFTTLIFILIVSFAVHYRRGSKADRSNPPVASRWMEVVWIGVPMLLGMMMFTWGAILFYRVYEPPPDALEVYVVGKQWMWKVQHSEGRAEINELHVPLGRPIKLTMISEDVIHSFFIPAFRVKQDVLPGRNTSIWFEPTQVGTLPPVLRRVLRDEPFDHGGLGSRDGADRVSAVALPGGGRPVDGRSGGAAVRPVPLRRLPPGQPDRPAPRLEGVYGRSVPIQQGNDVRFTLADDRYIRDSILRPKQEVVAGYQPLMPPFEGQINESDLFKIIAYIKSIGAKEATR